jgi:spore germination protein YaaH
MLKLNKKTINKVAFLLVTIAFIITSVFNPTLCAAVQKKKVLGFTTYYYSGDKSSYNSMVNNKKSIDEIATATHTTDAYGNLSGLLAVDQITYANANGIKPLLMVGNNFDGALAKTLLENSTYRANLINNITSALKTNNYRGVNIDFEGLYSSARTYLTTFMTELNNKIKPIGYVTAISVMAKTSDSPWLNYAYDYAALGSVVDEFMIMTYDEHYPGGTPGSVASIGWVTNVLNYAMTVVPKEKILIGLAAYGYDWSSKGTTSYSIAKCYSVAAAYGATVKWDDISKSKYFTYTDGVGVYHEVWFEDADSIGYKCDLVNQKDSSGVGIWRLGLENASFWNAINTKFNR